MGAGQPLAGDRPHVALLCPTGKVAQASPPSHGKGATPKLFGAMNCHQTPRWGTGHVVPNHRHNWTSKRPDTGTQLAGFSLVAPAARATGKAAKPPFPARPPPGDLGTYSSRHLGAEFPACPSIPSVTGRTQGHARRGARNRSQAPAFLCLSNPSSKTNLLLSFWCVRNPARGFGHVPPAQGAQGPRGANPCKWQSLSQCSISPAQPHRSSIV